jgi:hypothetical protein
MEGSHQEQGNERSREAVRQADQGRS